MTWRTYAACRGKPNWLFFDNDDETYAEKVEREKMAKALCAVCPVVDECLEDGKNQEGIWGGLTTAERRGKRRHSTVLERPFVEALKSDLDTESASDDANPWTVIETNGTHCIWQRDTKKTWHGFEWGVARNGLLSTVHDDLNAAYAAYGRLVE